MTIHANNLRNGSIKSTMEPEGFANRRRRALGRVRGGVAGSSPGTGWPDLS